jgi:hypothetical protein
MPARRQYVRPAPARGERVTVDRRLGSRFDRERLPVTCWCERRIVHLPASEIAAGRTASCGRPRCHPPTQETAA